jgi:polysaccharide pyruvyl transferase CsaB
LGTSRNRRALLLGYIGYENTGDEFLLRALCHGLRRHDVPIDLTVLTRHPEQTRRVHGVDTPDHPPFGGGVRPDAGTRLARLRATLQCDLFIMGPGGFFQDYDTYGVRNLFGVLRTALLARICGARVVGVGLGAGPIVRPWGKRLVRALCAVSDILLMRDQASIDLLKSLGVSEKKLRLVGDLAFAETAPEVARGSDDQKILGVSVFDFSSYIQGDSAGWQPVREALVAALNSVTAAGHAVHFIAMQGAFGGDDAREAEAIRARMDQPGTVVVHPYREDPGETFADIARCDWFLGMRLHSLIMAALAGVPFAGIGYHPKVTTFMNSLPHGADWHLDLESVDADGLQQLVARLVDASPAPVTAADLADRRDAAEENFRQLAAYCAHRWGGKQEEPSP